MPRKDDEDLTVQDRRTLLSDHLIEVIRLAMELGDHDPRGMRLTEIAEGHGILI